MKRLSAWDKKENIGFAKVQPSKRGYLALKANGGGGSHVGSGGGNGRNPCTCYYSYYCWIKGGASGSCVTGTCDKPNGGCGVFGNTKCDGKCQ